MSNDQYGNVALLRLENCADESEKKEVASSSEANSKAHKWLPEMRSSQKMSRGQVNWTMFRRARKEKRIVEYSENYIERNASYSGHCDTRIFQVEPSYNSKTRLWRNLKIALITIQLFSFAFYDLNNQYNTNIHTGRPVPLLRLFAEASLIVGDSAIEIQEVDGGENSQPQPSQVLGNNNPNIILGSTQTTDNGLTATTGQVELTNSDHNNNNINNQRPAATRDQHSERLPNGPLPPIAGSNEDVTDGDKNSRGSHDYDLSELKPNNRDREKDTLSEIFSARPASSINDDSDTGSDLGEKTITGKVVDFELTPAGGHNKAKIKKKKKKKAEKASSESFKKWKKKKAAEKKAMEEKEKKHLKKKKEEGKKGKKKWGHEEHGQKKKGKFKKKKWGKKVKKGKGVKKGKKGKKFLKDVGHKNTGFKTVYHKEEWGKSNKWHDIKREKKWDEKAKKWKNKWKKEKGKKYKGDHEKKFEKKKKEGKKYKKEKKDKYKKYKKEKFESGKKMKKEEHKKKKEGGSKKEMKEMKKKKKKKKP